MPDEDRKIRQREARARWRAANPGYSKRKNAEFYAANREHEKARAATYRAANRDRTNALATEWRTKHHERYAEAMRQWRAGNREHLRAYRKAQYEQKRDEELRRMVEWRKANPHKLNEYAARRKAAMLNATPAWADFDAIEFMYQAREAAQELFEVPVHVDHIVPLVSKRVCGLHCEANLRLLTKRENQVKLNHVWPDMWPRT